MLDDFSKSERNLDKLLLLLITSGFLAHQCRSHSKVFYKPYYMTYFVSAQI